MKLFNVKHLIDWPIRWFIIFGIRGKISWMAIIIIICFIAPRLSSAEDTHRIEIGIRTGLAAIKHDEKFNLYEAFGIHGLPWKARFSSGWVLDTGLNINAGVLRAAHDRGFIGSVGPIFTLNRPESRFLLIFGFRLALLENYEFGEDDLGGCFAFIEELGISYRLGWNFEAGYQFQHMSNAGIYENNPGVDLHVFELKYHFW